MTIRDVFLDQKRVNIYEHLVKTATRLHQKVSVKLPFVLFAFGPEIFDKFLLSFPDIKVRPEPVHAL